MSRNTSGGSGPLSEEPAVPLFHGPCENPDDEALRIALLVSEQEAEFGRFPHRQHRSLN